MKKKIGRSVCIMMLFMVLLSGCKQKYEGEEYEAVYTCEVVEDITQEEMVCFENLLFRYSMSRSWNVEGEEIGVFYYYLFVFEDGTVYCGAERFGRGNVIYDLYDYNDVGWSNLEDVYYLGRFSGEDFWEINQLIEKVDYNSELIINYDEPEPEPCAEESDYEFLNQREWNSMGFDILYENEEGDLEGFDVEGRRLKNGREEIGHQTTDQNALELMHFVEDSPFYTTWLELIFEEAE
ncbi:MAG: hypothetical protein IJZ00_11495 [Lachnospiraceae bacterium]|nr:hypothetical protein [Lachnospiraceae bacterium]